MIKFLTGTMKSGKSYELIQEITKAEGRALIIKPIVDTRDGDYIVSRATDVRYPALMLDEDDMDQVMRVILMYLPRIDHLFIDEVQFFSKEFIALLLCHCQFLDVDVTVAGLIKDFKDEKFPASEYLQGEADYVRFLHGECENCGKPSSDHNIRVDADGKMVTTGESVGIEGEFKYLTVCRRCKNFLRRNNL